MRGVFYDPICEEKSKTRRSSALDAVLRAKTFSELQLFGIGIATFSLCTARLRSKLQSQLHSKIHSRLLSRVFSQLQNELLNERHSALQRRELRSELHRQLLHR